MKKKLKELKKTVSVPVVNISKNIPCQGCTKHLEKRKTAMIQGGKYRKALRGREEGGSEQVVGRLFTRIGTSTLKRLLEIGNSLA